MTFGTITSDFRQVACPPQCPLCAVGAGHVTVGRIGEMTAAPMSASDGVAIPARTSPEGYREPLGTHIREALDIIADWRNEKRS